MRLFFHSVLLPVLVLEESERCLFAISRAFSSAYSSISSIIRFGETEGVALLTLFVSRYKITVKEEPQFAHETFKQRRDRILKSAQGITVTYDIFSPALLCIWFLMMGFFL